MIEQSFTLPCGVTIKNRIVKSAMSENMATPDNMPDKRFENLYSQWANGGAGLLITGNVMLDSTALGEPNNVVIEKNHECLIELKAWAQAGTQHNTHLWMQINHPGKQSPKYLSTQPVAPSAIAYKSQLKNMFNKPRMLSEEEILDIISRFAYTAKVAKESGFTGVQIHGAHGYLVSQFLSPLHNQRSDSWGGSLEKRMRFVVEIYKAIRNTVGDNYPIAIKLNSADFQKGGFSEEDSMQVMQKLGNLGIDLIEISGGTYESPKMMAGKSKKSSPRESTEKREAFFLDYCEKVRKLVETPLLLTGGFRTREGMDAALSSKACDFVGLARSIAIDPNFPNKILAGDKIESPVKPLSSGFKFLDKLVPLEIVWYSMQLHRMGKGKSPNPNASISLTILNTLFGVGSQMLKRNRSN